MWGYEALKGFDSVYLEDSWILGILAEPGSVKFDVDLVLQETHPEYRTPSDGEQHCYRAAEVVFRKVRGLEWTGQGRVRPAVDATGVIDYGSFDEFDFEGDRFILQGDFGRIEIVGEAPEIRLRSV